jgi:hypothetical protein
MSNEAVIGICENEACEERRATRDLKFWIVKTLVITFMILFTASVGALIYAVIIQEKDLDTGFIGGVFKGIFEVIHFILM